MNTKTSILLLATIATAVGIFMFGIFDQPAVPVWLSVVNAAVIGLQFIVVPLCLEWRLPGQSR